MQAQCISKQSIEQFIMWLRQQGAAARQLSACRRAAQLLYEWLPQNDKSLSPELLAKWKQSLGEQGYSDATVAHYIKAINRYFDYAGLSELKFKRGKQMDLAGRRFGELTAIKALGSNDRREKLWLCRCSCGKETVVPTVSLLGGNTLSCGCLVAEKLRQTNMFFEGTGLRQSLEERVHSAKAVSGYTGVTPKRGRWHAYIKYKGKQYSLGSYSRLEDAVKARARGKELVQQDALQLLGRYSQLYGEKSTEKEKVNSALQHERADK